MACYVFLICCMILGTASATLLGGERCTWGPSYWCKDIGSAKECNAVKHCLTTTWKYDLTADVDADDCCSKCESAIDRLRNYAVLTERDVLIILNSVCDVVPGDSLRQQCRDGVKTYVQDVLDMVTAQIDPKKICTLIRLCKKSMRQTVQTGPQVTKPLARVDLHQIHPVVGAVGDTETCELCKLAVLEVNNYIVNPDNQKAIVNYIKTQGCARCPEQAKCNQIVDQYKTIVFQILQEELKGDIVCDFLGLCDQSAAHPLKHVLGQLLGAMKYMYKNEDGACEYCTQTATQIRTYLADNNVKAQIENFVNTKLCTQCPAKDACVRDADQYLDKVFDFIDKELADGTICKQLHLCPAKPRAMNPVVNRPVTAMSKPKSSVTGVQCVLCEFVMRELDEILANNRTEKDIINALDKVCSLLPKTVKDECVDFINQYGNMVIQLLIQELAPDQICTVLGLCDSTTKSRLSGPLLFSPVLVRGEPVKAPLPVTAKFSVQCVLCEYVMSKLDSILQENSTEKEIVAAVDRVCSLLPSSIGSECDKLVKEYGLAIVKLLASELRPALVCTVLGLCPVSNEVSLPKSGEFCETCQTVIIYVDSLLKENATEEELEHLLLKVCNFLPESIRGECNMFVMLYTPEIIQMLINEVATKDICVLLKLCPPGVRKQQPTTAPPVATWRTLAPAKSVRLLGLKKCLYGPSYWCASRMNAEKCKATAHCEEHFWSKTKQNV